MSRFGRFLAVAALSSVFIWASTAAAEIYRYADEHGEMHAVSDLSQVPAQYREAAIADAEQRRGGSLNIVGKEGAESPAAQAPVPAPSAPPSASPGAPAAPDAATIGGYDRLWWQTQALEKQEKVTRLKGRLDAARADSEDDAGQIYRRPGAGPNRAGHGPGRHRGPGRAAVLSAADDTDEPSIDELEQGVGEAERELEVFHEQARMAGVPPGWLR